MIDKIRNNMENGINPEMYQDIQSNMSTEWKMITPELAAEYLKLNDGNRNLSKSHLKFLVEEIKKGNWKPTGDAVQFSDKGRLIDGQHRLNAVVMAKIAVPMMVTTNVPDESQVVVDTGKARSTGDVFTMNGINNPTIASALIKAYKRYTNSISSYGGDKKYIASNADVLREYESNAKFWSKVTLKAQSWYKNSGHLLAASQIGGFYVMFLNKAAHGRYNDSIAEGNFKNPVTDFMDKLMDGIGLERNTAVYVFHKQLKMAKMNEGNKSYKIPAKDLYTMFTITWNMHVEGKTTNRIKVPADGKTPKLLELTNELDFQ